MTDRNITVLIADDQIPLTDGLEMLLSKSGLDVVGKVYTALDAVKEYRRLRPDVLICDVMFVHSPGAPNGLDILSELFLEYRDARVILYSQFDDNADIQRAYRMGAMSYLTKDSVDTYLIDAIKNAAQGKVYFTDCVAHKIAGLSARKVQDDISPKELLDDRLYEIYIMTASGVKQEVIAKILEISKRTVTSEIKKIKDILKTTSPVGLTALAVKHKLVNLDKLIRQ